jgi:hypothetical protein
MLALAACVALASSACGGGKGVKLGEKHEVGDKASFSLTAADQTSNGKSVKVPEAYLKGSKGYVAIHADANGSPGPVLGVSDQLPAGETEDIHVKLKSPLKASTNVWPMLHLETNNNSTYDFPGPAEGPQLDGPAKVNNAVVVIKIHVKVR